ncbi:hypothetical protein NM688_g1057 [Phlebia brevispora]|uniref:Uncharacterized protein n=1 Tax=Phlebia brevispora TaxID=194682 RepID=A0ACC1TCV9_9APHY|nr:hypothetical protein NM688_g1057 [Phlebia brevispora]
MQYTSWKAQDLEPDARIPRPLPPKLLWAIAILLSLGVTFWAGSHTLSQFPVDDNGGIHLAVSPHCGDLSGTVADVNAGLELRTYNTIVSFGDSYTDGGRQDGSPLDPPILHPPDPGAGGRSTNGKVWIEHVADGVGARLMDYAASIAIWGLYRPLVVAQQSEESRFLNTFLSQANEIDSESTLFSIFFGINDYEASKRDGDHLSAAAEVILAKIQLLAAEPTSARSFLLADAYGRGVHTPAGEAYRQTLFSGLYQLSLGQNISAPVKVAFADIGKIWDGVLGPNPGYRAFGYTSTESCTLCNEHGCTMEGMCDDPAHYFYWIPGHPSKETMRIMADYVQKVLHECGI